jgi:hypothetical protein
MAIQNHRDFPWKKNHSDHSDDYPAWLCHRKSELENGGFIWFYMVLYGKYPLEMDVLYGFIWEYMGKSWEYMGIPYDNLVHSY